MSLPDSSDFPAQGLLITGATGFLGGCLVRSLLQRGVPARSIRCLVRDRDRALAAGIPAASLRLGDLGDPGADLAGAADGVGVVLHVAGAVKAWNRAGYEAVNVGGTARLLASVAARAPAAHVVFVSSLAAAGPSADGRGSAAPPAACRPVSAYGDSKRRAELLVADGRSPWTIVRPPVIYGPGDAATRLLFRQASAPFAAVPWRSRPLSVMHVDDVVDALVRAAGTRPAGAVLPLDGCERTDTHAFVQAIAAACGRRARLVRVPIPVAALAAAACDALAALRARAGYFSRDKVREIAAVGWVADAEPARSALGFAARTPLAEGLAAVAAAEGLRRPLTSATA